MEKEQDLQAAKVITNNTYMNDIMESTRDMATAKRLITGIENLIGKGGFQEKGWTFSSDPNTTEEDEIMNKALTKVLGVVWHSKKDQFQFQIMTNWTQKRKAVKLRKQTELSEHDILISADILTKRIILSRINSIFDQMGLAGFFTVRAKILIRQLWAKKQQLDWDVPIQVEHKQK